jgi:COP9 signalosome complex subunit 5
MADFKSASDTALLNAIWNKYWIATLSASPLLSNSAYITSQMKDLADKLEQAESGLSHFGRGGGGSYLGGGGGASGVGASAKKEESQLKKISRDASKLTREHLQAAMTQAMKHVLFNQASEATAMDTS